MQKVSITETGDQDRRNAFGQTAGDVNGIRNPPKAMQRGSLLSNQPIHHGILQHADLVNAIEIASGIILLC